MDLKTGYFSFHLEHNAIPDVIKDRLVPFHQNQASHPFCSSQGLMRRRTRCSPPWCLQGLSRLTVQAFFLLKKRQDLELVLFHLPVVTADSHTGAAAQRCCKKNHIICSFNTYKENSRRIKIYFRKLCLIICIPVVFLCFFVWDWAAVTGEGSLQSRRAVVLKVRRNRRGRKMKAGKFCKFNKKKNVWVTWWCLWLLPLLILLLIAFLLQGHLVTHIKRLTHGAHNPHGLRLGDIHTEMKGEVSAEACSAYYGGKKKWWGTAGGQIELFWESHSLPDICAQAKGKRKRTGVELDEKNLRYMTVLIQIS